MNATQLLAQVIELTINLPLGLLERLCSFRSEVFFNHTLQNTLRTRKQIFKRQAISLKDASGMAFNHRQARTRQDWRDWPFEQPVDFSRLSIVSDGRQKIILDHSAQGYVRTEPLGVSQSEVREFLSRVSLLRILCDVLPVLGASQSVSGAGGIVYEEGKRILRSCNLRVITRLDQFFTTHFDGRSNLMRVQRCIRVKGRRQRFESLIKRIEKHQPVTTKQ